MSLTAERWHADLMLRLLLDAGVPRTEVGAVDWTLFARLAQRNAVLLRLADALCRHGHRVPRGFAETVAQEERRVRDALALVAAIDAGCTRHAIPHVFPKVAQHHPDLGSDVDLLVSARTPAVDAQALSEVRAAPLPRTLDHLIAGTTGYDAQGCTTQLDIHHGRLGRFGEQVALAETLVRHRQRTQVGAVTCFVPAPEHQLVVQGLDRVLGRQSFRIADVLYTMALVGGGTLDWAAVAYTAAQAGARSGLAFYLRYVEQIHTRLFGRPLLPAAVRGALAPAGGIWEGRVQFRHGAFRFPALRVSGRLYLERLAADTRAGRWASAARLCLLGVIGTASEWRRLVLR
jgi:hypothetical protein